ncbi:hypothetical protein Bca4012_007939 [Brassica carinata]|uniref:Uncharacterized protein n=2 Tax=Brassica oleracea TaxID=3712 RepID=A0A0D3BM68_BRAOL|nr:unnamed protein product [Brassica oleracea]
MLITNGYHVNMSNELHRLLNIEKKLGSFFRYFDLITIVFLVIQNQLRSLSQREKENRRDGPHALKDKVKVFEAARMFGFIVSVSAHQ